MDGMGFLLKFALMQSVLLLEHLCYLDLKKLLGGCSTSDILLILSENERKKIH